MNHNQKYLGLKEFLVNIFNGIKIHKLHDFESDLVIR